MIKTVSDFFITPATQANNARDESLEKGFCLPALQARALYVVGLVASLAALPFLLLAGIYDFANFYCGHGEPPKDFIFTLVVHAGLLPVICAFSALFPLAWTRDLR